MAKRVSCPLPLVSRIFRNGRIRSTRARCQDRADNGRKHGQASAEPAAGIQDLQEGRIRSTRARCQDRADNGRKHGQASAEPAAGIQDLQEGASGAPGMDVRNWPTMATNMASA
nr:hypothetical protein NRS6107_04087 [Bacillus subtilis]